MRIILLAFFLTFTWAVLANDKDISYKVTGVKTHGRVTHVLVLDIESHEYGHENIWIYFNGENHDIKSLELFEEKNVAFISFDNREGRTVFNSDEVYIFDKRKKYIGNLHTELPHKTVKDRLSDIWNEGFFNFN